MTATRPVIGEEVRPLNIETLLGGADAYTTLAEVAATPETTVAVSTPVCASIIMETITVTLMTEC